MSDPFALKAAAFLIHVLDVDLDPKVLAADVVALKRDRNAGISAIELDSSTGRAAFLVYHYLLEERDQAGVTGQHLLEADRATLERATAQKMPGPRILASATADLEGYILATTPDVFRSLTGDGAEPDPDAFTGDRDAALHVRNESADSLLRGLRDVDTLAARWLSAFHAFDDAAGRPAFASDEENALALFLLDNASIRNLLELLHVVMDRASTDAARAMGAEAGFQPPV